MTKLPVKGLPANDGGRHLVRLNHKLRGGIPRYGIAKITNSNNAQSIFALVLGHDDDGAIFMPFDIRKALKVEKDGQLEFQIERVGIVRKICWYLQSPDPAVYLPAWIASISLVLAAIGITLAVCA